MKFKFITTKDPEYAQELKLRAKVLRAPLGLPEGSEVFPFEDEALHLIALDGAHVVGCVMFKPEGTTGRMHQLCVVESRRGRGIAGNLMAMIEEHLTSKGFLEIYIHAREPIVPFYEEGGYSSVGSRFTEIGLPHQKMVKKL